MKDIYSTVEKKVTDYAAKVSQNKSFLRDQIAEAKAKIESAENEIAEVITNGSVEEYESAVSAKKTAEYSLELAEKRLEKLDAESMDQSEVNAVYSEIAKIQNEQIAAAKKKLASLLGDIDALCKDLEQTLGKGDDLACEWSNIADSQHAVHSSNKSVCAYIHGCIQRGMYDELIKLN